MCRMSSLVHPVCRFWDSCSCSRRKHGNDVCRSAGCCGKVGADTLTGPPFVVAPNAGHRSWYLIEDGLVLGEDGPSEEVLDDAEVQDLVANGHTNSWSWLGRTST